jgi:molybdate transport system ATP-binding protein
MKLDVSFSTSYDRFSLDTSLTTSLKGVTGLFGPSGSGKTTFLRCIAGLKRAEKGYVSFGNQVWQDESKGIFIPPHQRPVGVVFQESRLFTHLSVLDNLNFGRKRNPTAVERVSWDEVLEILQLNPLLDRHPASLSGGEQQRVAIGRAILAGPELLLMDEPLASMDHQGKKRILGFIRQLQKRLQLPILHVSHDLEEILQLADYLALLEQGAITASGKITEIISRLDLPLSHRSDASTLVAAQVTKHDPAYHLNHLSFGTPKQTVYIPNTKLTIGEEVRIRIFARDVSLALKQPENSSILNLFPATVVEIAAENPAQFILRLAVSDTIILSRITKKSLENLDIKVGNQIIAQVKSVALDG